VRYWGYEKPGPHAQPDGMVERFNKTIEEYLSKVVDGFRRPSSWPTARRSTKRPIRCSKRFDWSVLLFGTPEREQTDVETYVGEL
jgi:hypothetical protein